MKDEFGNQGARSDEPLLEEGRGCVRIEDAVINV
jgi:hypothetical protein